MPQGLGSAASIKPETITEAANSAIEPLLKNLVEHFGRIDVWVNNAVLAAVGRLEEVPP